jgi:hypothetical protein
MKQPTLLELKPIIAEYAVALCQDQKLNLTMQEAIAKAIEHFKGDKENESM